MPRMIFWPRNLHPGQGERGHRVDDQPEGHGADGDDHRVDQELDERHPFGDAGVVVQRQVADRQEGPDRGQVGEDLQIGLEAGDDHEQQRQAEHQGQHDPQDHGQHVAHEVLVLAGLVHDWRRVGDVAEMVVGNGVRFLAGGAGHQIGHRRGILVTSEVALDQRDDEHQDEEDQRDGRGVSGLLLLEPGADGLEDQCRGGVEGSALGHDVDLGEQGEGGDGDGDQDEGRGLPQARPGDVGELLPGVGAVDRGRLVELTGDGL